MEKYFQLFKEDEGPLIFPQKSYAYDFDFAPEKETEYRTFFTGETDMFYYWKTEYCSTPLYRRIADALVCGTNAAYGLRFKGAEYPIICGHKITWNPVLAYLGLKNYTDDWKLGVSAKADGVKINDGGYLRLTCEVRFVKENLIKKQTKNTPDIIYTIDFPEGSYENRQFSLDINIPKEKVANVCYFIEGENFDGEIVFETPFMTSSNGYNVIPPFAPDTSMYSHHFNWIGVNLSKAEWPKMQIILNGKVVFDDEFFERCHRYSEKEIVMPENSLVNGKNHIEFKVTSDCHDPLPYRLHEFGIVAEASHSFDIVACPEIAVAGRDFALLLDLKTPCTLTLSSKAVATSSLTFDEGGLQYLRLCCSDLQNDLDISLSDGSHTEVCTVKRVLERGYDNVITGTGDLIYINQDYTDTMNYFKWYTQNNIGKLMTIRPTYRWCGTRSLQRKTWEKMTHLLNGMGIEYSHMVDGREPQGYCANPSLAELSVKTDQPSLFLGRQLHERDGAYCYWGDYTRPGDFWNLNDFYDTEQIFDQFMRMRRLDPEHAGGEFYPEDLFDDGKRYWLCHDPSLPADMEIVAKSVINSMSVIKNGSTRHTGPAIFFKYFCMAGYTWIGAETMDSPTEFLMAALRGAAHSYNIERTGVHHALQWSSSPHDNEMRFRRYRLALYVCYMQGTHESNTEEGLWHMEEYYESHHRFSHAAKEHLKMQQDFSRYIASHTRRGQVHAPVAVLHGRFDGYPCFGGSPVWGQSSARFARDFDAENGWQIPKLSYFPNDTKAWACFAHPCPQKPIGLVSGNPRGLFDIVPVEKPIDNSYKLMTFFAYNKAEKDDLDRILANVRNGATLMLTLAQLSDTTNRADIQNYHLAFPEHEIFDVLGFDGQPQFTDDTYNGKSVPVAQNIDTEAVKVLCKTDSGRALVVEARAGEGKIVLFNTKLYPGSAAISELYTSKFEQLVDEHNENEYVMPIVDNTVQAVIYDLEDGTKEIYFIAVDWWIMENTDRAAKLRVGESTYDISLPFGVMKKVTVSGDTVIWGDSESADVLEVNSNGFIMQGEGVEHFHLAENGKVAEFDVDFTDLPRKEVTRG